VIIEPKEWWHWNYCRQANSLVLQLDSDFKFVCAIQNKQLIPSANAKHAFCLQDSQLYFQVIESLSKYDFSDPQRVQIALNFIANAKFHRPLMPQSWFFDALPGAAYQPKVAELVELRGKYFSGSTGLLVNDKARFLVVESGHLTSTVMLIDPELQLKSGKTLDVFQQIKVMNDRIAPEYTQHELIAQFA